MVRIAEKFAIGIENEFMFAHTDKDRKRFGFNTRGAPHTQHGINGTAWERGRSSNTKIWYDHADPTVWGGGNEYETDLNLLGKKPKELVTWFTKAQNVAVKKSKSSGNDEYRTHMKNPFGAGIGDNHYSHSGDGDGSYHLWLTMPYDTNKISDSQYKLKRNKKLFNGLKTVRMIQPLIVAMTGGADYSGVGTPEYAEGSGRQAYNSYANMGNASLNDTFFSSLQEREPRGWKYVGGDKGGPAKFRNLLDKTLPGRTVSRGRQGGQYVSDFNMRRWTGTPVNSVEMRFLDNFRTDELYPVMKLIIASLEHGGNVDDLMDGKNSRAWNEASARVVEEGWNAQLPKSYVTLLNSKLGTDVKLKRGQKSIRADLLFKQVEEQIWNKNKNGSWTKQIINESNSPNVKNMSKESWEAQFRMRYLTDDSFKKYANRVFDRLRRTDATASGGWINVRNKGTSLGARDFFIDDNIFGVEFGAEDFEDILHYLHRLKKIDIREDNTGRIQQIKVKYSDLSEVEDAINKAKISEDRNIIGVNPLIHKEGERTEPERPTPIPSERRVVTPSIQGAVNISLSQLRITEPDFEVSEEAEYDRQDLREVFRNANFLNEQQQEIIPEIKFANITYQQRRLQAFWVKQGDRRVIIYLNKEFTREETLTQKVERLKSNFYSANSVERSNIYVSNTTVSEFFRRLSDIARREYDKLNQRRYINKINLDRAGMTRLKNSGVEIGSFNNGKNYLIMDKNKYAQARPVLRSRGTDIRILKSIPYWKKMYVKVDDDILILKDDKKVYDTLRRKVMM